MSGASKSNATRLTGHRRPAWIDWAWLAFAATVVILMVVGYVRAGRSFWRLACEHSHSFSSQRA